MFLVYSILVLVFTPLQIILLKIPILEQHFLSWFKLELFAILSSQSRSDSQFPSLYLNKNVIVLSTFWHFYPQLITESCWTTDDWHVKTAKICRSITMTTGSNRPKLTALSVAWEQNQQLSTFDCRLRYHPTLLMTCLIFWSSVLRSAEVPWMILPKCTHFSTIFRVRR